MFIDSTSVIFKFFFSEFFQTSFERFLQGCHQVLLQRFLQELLQRLLQEIIQCVARIILKFLTEFSRDYSKDSLEFFLTKKNWWKFSKDYRRNISKISLCWFLKNFSWNLQRNSKDFSINFFIDSSSVRFLSDCSNVLREITASMPSSMSVKIPSGISARITPGSHTRFGKSLGRFLNKFLYFPFRWIILQTYAREFLFLWKLLADSSCKIPQSSLKNS